MLEATRIHVVAAVVTRDTKVLVALRPDDVHQGGLWEFPGGKREPGESRADALLRELREEVGIDATAYRPLLAFGFDYPDKRVWLDVWKVTEWTGKPRGVEHQRVEWRECRELEAKHFPAANHRIIAAVQLPETYAITPELAQFPDHGLQLIEGHLAAGTAMLQLRSKQLDSAQIQAVLERASELPNRGRCRLLVNSTLDTSSLKKIDGVHLTTRDLMSASSRPLGPETLVAASCHTTGELQKAEMLGLDFAVLSPVRATDSHPHTRPLGWPKFASMIETTNIPVYALGGLTYADLAIARRHGAQGIAAIRGLAI